MRFSQRLTRQLTRGVSVLKGLRYDHNLRTEKIATKSSQNRHKIAARLSQNRHKIVTKLLQSRQKIATKFR